MNKEELLINKDDLIDWIDRPPSNNDLDLITFITTRLENFYDLQEENKRLKELCDKYEEEHSTRFNDWVFDKRENERLKERFNALLEAHKIADELEIEYQEKNKEIERLNNIIERINEEINDYFAYDYEDESIARLDTLNSINNIIKNEYVLKEGK